jgi:hypothetical protein
MGKFNSPSHAWWPHSPKMCDGDISHRTCCGPASFPSKMWGVGQPPHPKTHHCTLKPPRAPLHNNNNHTTPHHAPPHSPHTAGRGRRAGVCWVSFVRHHQLHMPFICMYGVAVVSHMVLASNTSVWGRHSGWLVPAGSEHG